MSFSGPTAASTSTSSALRSTAAASQGRKQRLMNDVERDMSPSPRQSCRGAVTPNEDPRTRSHLPMKESRFGNNANGSTRDQGQHDAHPGELVTCKKRRKDREKPGVITRSGSSGPVSPPSMGRGIRSPGTASTPRETRASTQQQQQVWANQCTQQANGSSSGGAVNVSWAHPVKRSRTDAGKRRPSIL